MVQKISSNGFELRLLFIMLAGVLALALSVGSGFAANPSEDNIAIRWGNQVITKEDVDLRVKSLPPELQEQLKDPGQMKNYLESLIQIKTVGTEARARKLDKTRKISIRINDTVDSILLQEYMNGKIKLLPAPTEAEILGYYEIHKSEFVTPPFVKARHILIESKPDTKPEDVAKAKAKADKIYEELAAGGNFEQLAEKYSDDKDNKSKGGDLGLFQPEQMVPEFSGPVFKMKKGELGKPFLTPFGFHIVKIDDYIPSKQMELKDVHDDVKVRADNENRDKLIQSEFVRLKKKYKATIVETKKK